ncbi:MAG: CDP-alcohol phosphatidyltransferase family protein [Candidatus Bathyarchaeia archaeon]|nr:CDP-alcohol phosphatidyltransferase family protein [Candidatus Bathyarchaeota archaeon]
MPVEWDGIVSRYINRKFSRPVARFLARYPSITPNHISLLSFFTALASGLAFYLCYPALGGILSQIASILDGVDGDLAKLTFRTSPFGGFLDAMLDRYADTAILAGMIGAIINAGLGNTTSILVGLTALFGSLLVSYSRARAASDLKLTFNRGFSGYAANRDVRLFVIMVGGLLNQIFMTLIIVAILTNLNVLARIWICWKSTKQGRQYT